MYHHHQKHHYHPDLHHHHHRDHHFQYHNHCHHFCCQRCPQFCFTLSVFLRSFLKKQHFVFCFHFDMNCKKKNPENNEKENVVTSSLQPSSTYSTRDTAYYTRNTVGGQTHVVHHKTTPASEDSIFSSCYWPSAMLGCLCFVYKEDHFVFIYLFIYYS